MKKLISILLFLSFSVFGQLIPFPGPGVINSCTYSISPSSASYNSDGGAGSVSITTSSGCYWNSYNPYPSWVTILGGSSGTGSGTLYYSVTDNTSSYILSGNIIIAGKTFSLTQSAAGCPSGSINSSSGVVPYGCSSVLVVVCAGGGGGSNGSIYYAGSGGGGGGCSSSGIFSVVPGESWYGSSGNYGGPGGIFNPANGGISNCGGSAGEAFITFPEGTVSAGGGAGACSTSLGGGGGFGSYPGNQGLAGGASPGSGGFSYGSGWGGSGGYIGSNGNQGNGGSISITFYP
jgi:hypothetical protein